MTNNKKFNFLTVTDSYKYSHANQYPEGTTKIFSYLESRGGTFDETVFFGLQYFLKEYLQGKVVETWMIDEVEEFAELHFGNKNVFDRSRWDYIVDKHDGHLPLRIRAIPEGMVIPTKNVLMTIENTDDNCFWLTNFVETLLLKVWYPTFQRVQKDYQSISV
jgi:nicotinamide phosphoribosyltransferase